jgi:KipI family sensor histidine kinase inhibitor
MPSNEALCYPRFLPVGDAALTVEFGDEISRDLNDRVVALDTAIAGAAIPGVVETIPCYRSLLVCFDPMVLSFDALVEQMRRLLATPRQEQRRPSTLWSVPLIYDPPYAEDLPEIAQHLGLAQEDVIALHSGVEYLVYLVGFAPGFPYLGDLPPRLHLPRRAVPRPQLPAGAAIIGGGQAAIMPIPLPSGWFVLGRTPVRLFDPHGTDPFLFHGGDRVRFRRIDADEYDRLASLPDEAARELMRMQA